MYILLNFCQIWREVMYNVTEEALVGSYKRQPEYDIMLPEYLHCKEEMLQLSLLSLSGRTQ